MPIDRGGQLGRGGGRSSINFVFNEVVIVMRLSTLSSNCAAVTCRDENN